MLQKDGSIVLNNFQQGQAESPYIGYAKMQCVNLIDTQGVVKIQPRTVLKYATNGLPTAIVRDIYGNEYVGTDTGYLYKNGVVLQSGLTRVFDLLIFKGYLLIFRDTVIDCYGLLNSAPTYFSSWKTGLTTGYWHKAIADPDNDIFITNAGSVAKITSFVAGIPTVAPTATLTVAEKDLPTGEYARTLAMKGIFLAIGTQAGSAYTDVEYGIGNIYFWDRGSTLFEDNFLQFNENGVHQILNIGNSLIVHAGTHGNIYETNGVSIGKPKKINFNIENNATTLPLPNAIAQIGDEILVGTSTNSDSFPSLSTHGVWTVNKGASSIRNIISTDGVGASQNLVIGSILTVDSGANKTILIGWRDGSSYGVDEIDLRLYDDYQTVIESQIYRVGEYLNKKPYSHLEILIGEPLVSGQTIRVSYRTNLTDSFTVLGTYTTSNTDSGQVVIMDSTISIVDAILLQLKVEMKQATTSTYLDNISLMEVRLR